MVIVLSIASVIILGGYFRELVLRKRAERLLSLRERKMQTILNNAPIVFSAVDTQPARAGSLPLTASAITVWPR
ncbi:MAG: hypothetical protein EOP06_14275, partial [Proteobacteria bacterium]